MIRVIYTPRARRELIGIIDTIAIDNQKAAIAFAGQLEHHCSLLAMAPEWAENGRSWVVACGLWFKGNT
jgi:plasmid stabilization system protein ParE